MGIRSQQGLILALAAVMAGLALLALAALDISWRMAGALREQASDRVLLQAREALVAYASDRSISRELGPGYLPCPDLDDDGWAESTCGSLTGDVGQAQRIGRLPWKTLGLPDLRDGDGERLWYAVSTKYKGLLNCQASVACVDMSPDAALGTITVRDASGALVHDGTLADPLRAGEGGAAAVIIAPGAPLRRATDGIQQARGCAPGDCDAAGRCVAEPPQRAARCDPRNYLDARILGDGRPEDNAEFHDRTEPASRSGNGNGFVAGPMRADSQVQVNDRVVAIGYHDIAPRVMGRVAAEVAYCLVQYAARPENGGRFPWAAMACGGSPRDAAGAGFGRIATPPFDATRADSAGRMLADWSAGCNIAPAGGWWRAWRQHIFVAVAPAFQPAATNAGSCAGPGACLTVENSMGEAVSGARRFAVLVGGPPIHRPGYGPQDHRVHGDPQQWLEGSHGDAVAASPCTGVVPDRITAGTRTPRFNDVVVAMP